MGSINSELKACKGCSILGDNILLYLAGYESVTHARSIAAG